MNKPEPQDQFGGPLVHEGLDGWLFLQAGSNFVTSLYHRTDGNLPDRRLEMWRRLIEQRAARARALGIDIVHVVVPDKLTLYGDRLAAPIVDPAQSPALRLAEMMARSPAQAQYLDLVEPMRRLRSAQNVYWRTDSHWTPEGCFAAYLALCERLAIAPIGDLLDRPHQEITRLMDLGGRVAPPQAETVRHYDFAANAQRVWTNWITRCLEDPFYDEAVHIGARARFSNPGSVSNKTVLLFGDSYARPNAEMLTGMLAESVGSLDFVWSSSIDWRLVKRLKPDIVICEVAERFLARLPNDRSPIWREEARQARRAGAVYFRKKSAALRLYWKNRVRSGSRNHGG